MSNTYYIEPGRHKRSIWSIVSYIGGHRSTIASGYTTRKAATLTARLLAGRKGRVVVCNR